MDRNTFTLALNARPEWCEFIRHARLHRVLRAHMQEQNPILCYKRTY